MKATYKGKKKFTLRNVDPTLMTSSSDLKDFMKTNFHDVKPGDFNVGYMVGTEVIRVQTKEDSKKCGVRYGRISVQPSGVMAWLMMRVASPINLDVKESVQHLIRNQMTRQLQVSQQRHRKRKRLQEVVDVDSLKSKRRTKCTVLQLRILAELVSSGLYTSTEESPCNNSMLQRAGGGSSKIKVSLALTKFSLVLQKQYQYHLVSLSSPARLIDS